MIDTVIIVLLLLIIALLIAIGNAVDRYCNNLLHEIQILTRGKAVKDTDKQYVCEMLFGDGRVEKVYSNQPYVEPCEKGEIPGEALSLKKF